MGVGTPRMCKEYNGPSGTPPPEDIAGGAQAQQIGRLKHVLEADYRTLLQRLTNSLRSRDRAAEALHDAYLKLDRGPAVGEVKNPIAYLYKMALNMAHNVTRRDMRILSFPPGTITLALDESPSPERVAIARRDMERVVAALSALPPRRRDIFLARWRDELTQEEIAGRFGIHKRTVQKELLRAEKFVRSSASL